MENLKEKDNIIIPMEISLKELGVIIKKMELENIF